MLTHIFVGTVDAEKTCSCQKMVGLMYSYIPNLCFIDVELWYIIAELCQL
jgi:hypothetical protein